MTQTSMALALAGLSFMMTVIWGSPFLRILRYFEIGKIIRVEGPERHFSKLGTPTIGGILFVLPVAMITMILNAASYIGTTQIVGRSVFVPLGVLGSYAILGAIDDWMGLRGRRRGEGMRARVKFAFSG